MKKKVLIGSLVLVAGIFLILQVKYANQTKLASLAAENKAEKTVQQVTPTPTNAVEQTPSITTTPTGTTSPTGTSTPKSGVEKTLNDAVNKSQSAPLENNKKFSTSEKSIAKRYAPKFAAIKGNFVSEIDGMIAQAKAEYAAIPADKRALGKVTLGFKYMAKGDALEKQCDADFYAELNKLKADLKKNKLSPSLANTAKREYLQQKSTVKKALTKKLLG